MLSPRSLLTSSIFRQLRQAVPRPNNRTFSATSRIMAQEYKLKGLTSLDLKAGEKREVEVEGIEEGKVLLCNVGGKTSAIGARCTHYGAPLVKGVLTGDGRLTCPWHGACFKASNGDIENAPAIDALPSFELSEKSGGVYVTGEESAIKNSRRKPKLRVNGKAPEKVVVVGGGSGALGAIEALREGGFTGGITMISSEGHTPYDRTKLSKALIDDHSKIALRDEDWFKDASVDVVYDQVTDIVFDGKKVATKSGNSFSYTKLILATGGSPKNLPLPGFKDLGNIFLLRTIPHVKEIVSAIGSKNKKIVVIGSSFIGMEVANATSKDNTVTVVGMESAPLERVMGAEVGKIFQSQLSKSGITFKLSAGVEKAIPSSTDSSNVGGVVLKDGTTLEADLVILGIGVSPQTSYLQDNDAVQLEKDGSLKTNEHFQLDGHKDVYAIGDIATYPYHGPGGNGTPTRIEHWNVAQNAGRAAANHILHPDSDPKLFTPIFWSALGSQLRYCGATPNGWDTLTLKGEPNEGKFAAYYSKGDTVVAVATMGMDPIMSQASELMRRGVMPSKGEIEGGVDILGIDVPAL